jgi:hypothetical protein
MSLEFSKKYAHKKTVGDMNKRLYGLAKPTGFGIAKEHTASDSDSDTESSTQRHRRRMDKARKSANKRKPPPLPKRGGGCGRKCHKCGKDKW